MPKLLLFRGSPRSDIQPVEEQNPLLPCDKLIVRYAHEFHAYEKARNFFLKNTEYDYLVLATDDIVVKPEHIVQLATDLTLNNYQVLAGIMNVDQHEYMRPEGKLNITYSLALKDKKLRSYEWIYRKDLPETNIFQVKFNGFALMAIRRDVVEMTPFATDSIFKGNPMHLGASLDFVFCWFCHENNIPIFVDKRIDMQHLRAEGRLKHGELSPKILYIRKDGNIKPYSWHDQIFS